MPCNQPAQSVPSCNAAIRLGAPQAGSDCRKSPDCGPSDEASRADTGAMWAELIRDADALDERVEARVAVQIVECRMKLEIGQKRHTLLKSLP